ncbi:type III pantothenate kinase [Massilia terrae]|uniref:Type III pantothenate kinase n=1 Tax=Massilia terrae TaxID=1811224 RepID=A0ABT2D3M8_9BURK|nr:type III pantothenate kinase [Massilia terrae]MCS0660855.1 type III pantothenate kinase [Massilia terrae]
MKLLLVDAGNTRVKWAIADHDAALGHWLLHGAVAHADLDVLADAWRPHGVKRSIVANVAGAELRARLAALLPPGEVEWFASTARRAGVANGYRNPAQLGADRFAAAIGAHALAPGQAVVVAMCGTATTVDAVGSDGAFIGGMILPGLALMASSLARNTAQLPQAAPGAAAPPLFADNTNDAIVSGCLSAQAGAIERAMAAHRAGECILSGGASPWVASALNIPHRLVDNMVLVGLHAAAQDANDMEA